VPPQALSFDEHTPPADAGDAWRAEADRFQHGVVSIDTLQLYATPEQCASVQDGRWRLQCLLNPMPSAGGECWVCVRAVTASCRCRCT
jgi:hypothetical protein